MGLLEILGLLSLGAWLFGLAAIVTAYVTFGTTSGRKRLRSILIEDDIERRRAEWAYHLSVVRDYDDARKRSQLTESLYAPSLSEARPIDETLAAKHPSYAEEGPIEEGHTALSNVDEVPMRIAGTR